MSFFDDPGVDRVLGITMAVAQEVGGVLERLDTLERLLVQAGTLQAGAVQAYVPDAAAVRGSGCRCRRRSSRACCASSSRRSSRCAPSRPQPVRRRSRLAQASRRRGLTAMLINNWYVACAAAEVTADKPLRVQMLGCHFVLFRDAAGAVACLADTCPHRGAALGDGELVGHEVACPYHGWRFGADGRCTHIPALGPEVAPPKRVRVDRYPTQEKYGWVWAFLGDLPEAQRPRYPGPVPRVRRHGALAPHALRVRGQGQLDALRGELARHRAHQLRPPAVRRHAHPEARALTRSSTRSGARGLRASKPAPQQDQKSGEIAKLLAAERSSTQVTLEFSLVGLCHRIQPTFREGMSQINFTARTPIDD